METTKIKGLLLRPVRRRLRMPFGTELCCSHNARCRPAKRENKTPAHEWTCAGVGVNRLSNRW